MYMTLDCAQCNRFIYLTESVASCTQIVVITDVELQLIVPYSVVLVVGDTVSRKVGEFEDVLKEI